MDPRTQSFPEPRSDDGAARLPRVVLTEETLREGVQIERRGLSVEDKLRVLHAIEDAGATRIVVGSFVSPRWTPQMSAIDDLIAHIEPKPNVTYLGLALNERGRERMARWSPPLTIEQQHRTQGHLCTIFAMRNTNRTSEQHEAQWEGSVRRAVADGATAAMIGISSAWGSNWQGKFVLEQRMADLRRQARRWEDAGILVTQVGLDDPMGWNDPAAVHDQLRALVEEWPAIETFRLHLHNQRGMAIASSYAAITALEGRHTLYLDSTLGGVGGCPYCGNGAVAGMAATEDLVQLLTTMGIASGIDLYRIVEASILAEEIIGRPLYGHVSKAGPLPDRHHRYPVDLPVIETPEQAQHFRLGPGVYEGQPRPWES